MSQPRNADCPQADFVAVCGELRPPLVFHFERVTADPNRLRLQREIAVCLPPVRILRLAIRRLYPIPGSLKTIQNP